MLICLIKFRHIIQLSATISYICLCPVKIWKKKMKWVACHSRTCFPENDELFLSLCFALLSKRCYETFIIMQISHQKFCRYETHLKWFCCGKRNMLDVKNSNFRYPQNLHKYTSREYCILYFQMVFENNGQHTKHCNSTMHKIVLSMKNI